MQSPSQRQLVREFFHLYPDYSLCRSLAENIQVGVTTRSHAIEMLARKARAEKENQLEILDKLNKKVVRVRSQWVEVKNLALREIMDQPSDVLKEIVDFYFKHPYAHGRTLRTRFLPRVLRTIFLSVLLGHAKRRGIELDYESYFETLKLL